MDAAALGTVRGPEAIFRRLDRALDRGVNPAISDSSTFGFTDVDDMHRYIDGEGTEGQYIYSRHQTSSTAHLGRLLATLEGTEAALPTASGMGAITAAVLQSCREGDEIVAAQTIYGGTYALFANILPRFGISPKFVDLDDAAALDAAMSPRTRLVFCESLSNPLLAAPDLRALSRRAHEAGALLVVDNTFLPGILYPADLGADVIVHSLTKYINGMADSLGGVICATREFVNRLQDLQSGCAMLFGAALDSAPAASIAKNVHTLHLRMRQHSQNALAVATKLEDSGLRVVYPGLTSHPDHRRLAMQTTPSAGAGGVLTLDVGDGRAASDLLGALSRQGLGHLAVSLGYFRTLFTVPGRSTASELSAADRTNSGLGDGLIRISVGIDPDIRPLLEGILAAMPPPPGPDMRNR